MGRSAYPGRAVIGGHQLDAQAVGVLEGEDRVAEPVLRPLEADSVLDESLSPVAEGGGRDGEGGDDDLARADAARSGALDQGKKVMIVPGLPPPSP